MASIKDIADQTGFSIATVSRVLNHKGYISQATRECILQSAKQLHYVPNELARSLNTGFSKLIGLLIPSVEIPYFAQLTYAVEHVAYQHGYKVLICNSEIDMQIEKGYVEMLKRNQVSGIIMASQNQSTEEYDSIDSPLVLIERSFSTHISSVVSDNYSGGVMATELLVQRGCRFLGHIAGSRSIKPALRRTEAFISVAEKYRLPYAIQLERIGCNAASAADNLLTENPGVDGVFCSSDDEAIALMMIANKRNLRIPEDLRIIGFDGTKIALDLNITTIRQPIEEIGRRAFLMLLDQMENKNSEIRHDVLPVELHVGKTT